MKKKIFTWFLLCIFWINSFIWNSVFAFESNNNNNNNTQNTQNTQQIQNNSILNNPLYWKYFKTTNKSLNKKIQNIINFIDKNLDDILQTKLYNKLSQLKVKKQLSILKKINDRLETLKTQSIIELEKNRQNFKQILRLYLILKIEKSIEQYKQIIWNEINNITDDIKNSTIKKEPFFKIEKISTETIPDSSNIELLKIVFNKNYLNNKQIKISWATFKLKWLIERNLIWSIYLSDKNWIVIWNNKSFNSDYTATLNLDYSKNNIIDKNNNIIYLKININNDSNVNWQVLEIDWKINLEWSGLNNTNNTIDFTTNKLKVVWYKTQELKVEWYWLNNEIYVWETSLLWQFNITAWNWNSTKDVKLENIILDNKWTNLEKNVKNIVLKDENWKIIAKEVEQNRDYVSLKFLNNYIIKNWETKTFYIYWEVIDWTNWDFIQFWLDENNNILWYENNSEIPVNTDVLNDDFWKYFIKTWKITMSKSNLSNTDTNVAIWTDNEVVKFNVYTPQSLSIDSFVPNLIIKNDSWIDWINIKNIFSTITLYSCTDETYKNCNSIWTFDFSNATLNNWEIKQIPIKNYISQLAKWNNFFIIKIKTFNDIPENIKYWIKIDKTNFIDLENFNWDKIDEANINWMIETQLYNLVNPKVLISYNNPYWTLEYIKGWKDISFWNIILSPNISNVNLNDFRFQIKGVPDNSWLNLSNIQAKLYLNGILKDTKTIQPDWTIDFNDNILLNKDETTKIEIKIDTDTSLYNWDQLKQLQLVISNKNDFMFITQNWIKLTQNNIIWNFPLESDIVNIYPTAKILFSNDNTITNSQILYWTDFNLVYTYKVKPKYDNIKLEDLYVWLYNNWSLYKDNSIISQIKYKTDTKEKYNAILNWIASLNSIKDIYQKDKNKLVSLYAKANKISNISQDNKTLNLCILNDWDKKSKYISITNGETINESNYIWDNLCSNNFTYRKSMIKAYGDLDNYNTEITANNAEYTLYQTKIEKLNKNNEDDLVKQITFQINTSNVDTGEDININNFKLEISTDWKNYISQNNLNWIEYQVVKYWDDFSSTWYDSNASIDSSWNNVYLLTVRFTWKYNNWYNFNDKLYIRLKATLNWFWNNDSISVWLQNYDDNLNWTMKKYSDFESWKWPYNAIIWSDNANPNNTSINDKNYFEDYNVINNNIQYHILYKN